MKKPRNNSPPNQAPTPSVVVSDDENKVLHAQVAFFGQDAESHVRFCLGQDSVIYVLGIWREPDDHISGTAMLEWLAQAYGRPLQAVEVAPSAVGFWKKMRSRQLVAAWHRGPLAVLTAPVALPQPVSNRAAEMPLYHATALDQLASIAGAGMKPGSYWTCRYDIAAAYAETVEDDGDRPVILQVDLARLDADHAAPDMRGLEEPLTYTLGQSEDQIMSQWNDSGKTWRDSLSIIGSLRYKAGIPSACLFVHNDHEPAVPLGEYLRARQAVKPPRP